MRAVRYLQERVSFILHIPPAQIVARLRLQLIYRVAERLALRAIRPPGLAIGNPVIPDIFPRRLGRIEMLGGRRQFSFLGRTVVMSEKINWAAPSDRASDQLWRMNLHYMEYLEELDPAMGLAALEAWIAANPSHQRGYWRHGWNSYVVSTRVVAWMQFLVRISARPSAIVDSLAAQVGYLERHLEIDIKGNHLIKNIKALIIASVFFSGRAADRWRTKGIALLAAELPAQILGDGTHFERSPSYHAQVFADLIEIRNALGCDPLNGILDETLRRMLSSVILLSHPDGMAALFNDSGLHMAYKPRACIAAYAKVLGVPPPLIDGPFGLTDAGYYGLRAGDTYFVADMGRIGPDSLPAHAHGDVGSFELSVNGERIIVDPGVYEYVAGPLRAASRSASSHNTLAVDGVDQAAFYDAFRCGRRPRVDVEEWTKRDESFELEGRHNGYEASGVTAIRRISASPKRYVITDRILANKPVRANVSLLLHPGVTVTFDAGAVVLKRGKAVLKLCSTVPPAVEAATWYPDMGVSRGTSRLFLTLPDGCYESRMELSVR
jgi:uncharacterized heparinase superfamily protein